MEASGVTGVASLDQLDIISVETAELCDTVRGQMASVLAMAAACKMRLASAPDSSRLVLQSLLPSAGPSYADPSILPTETKSSEKLLGRSYSSAQSDAAAGTTIETRDSHTDHLLQMFSSTLQTSSSSVPNKDQHGQGEQLGTVSETSVLQRAVGQQEAAAPVTRGLRRQGSSPEFSSLLQQKDGGIVNSFLKRRASSGALFSVAESGERISAALVPRDSSPLVSDSNPATTSGAVQKSGGLAASIPGDSVSSSSMGTTVDSTGSSSSKSKGFGILNHTRRFGAWLGKVTHGEKMEVTKKDLNVFAPTSF